MVLTADKIAAWTARLRDPATKQCTNRYFRESDGAACILGHGVIAMYGAYSSFDRNNLEYALYLQGIHPHTFASQQWDDNMSGAADWIETNVKARPED